MNKFDEALLQLRRAHDAVEESRRQFSVTLNLWASAKTPANIAAHVAAREKLSMAVKNLKLAEQRSAGARAELFSSFQKGV